MKKPLVPWETFLKAEAEYRKRIPFEAMARHVYDKQVDELCCHLSFNTFEFGFWLKPYYRQIRGYDREYGTTFSLRQLTPKVGETALDWFDRSSAAMLAHIRPRTLS